MNIPTGYIILAVLLSIFVLIALVAFSKWRELIKERKLRELVAWSATGGYCPALQRYSYTRELLYALHNAQFDEAIDKKYRFKDEDEPFIKEIITAYQKDIMLSYFKGTLKTIESKYAIDGDVYFILALYAFLSEHQGEYEFLGHKMHKERTSYKSYGEGYSAGFDATYSLTEFALVFHKMHYITYMYCKKSKILNQFVPEWNEKNLKEILDSQQIHLSRM